MLNLGWLERIIPLFLAQNKLTLPTVARKSWHNHTVDHPDRRLTGSTSDQVTGACELSQSAYHDLHLFRVILSLFDCGTWIIHFLHTRVPLSVPLASTTPVALNGDKDLSIFSNLLSYHNLLLGDFSLGERMCFYSLCLNAKVPCLHYVHLLSLGHAEWKVIREWELFHWRVGKTTRQAYEGVPQTEYIIIIHRKSLKPLHIFCLGSEWY